MSQHHPSQHNLRIRQVLRRRRRAQRGSVAVLAIVALAVTLVFVLIVADTAINARMASSRQATQASLRALTDAGLNYGYWKVYWQGASVPYTGTRTLGNGSFTVSVTDNSASLANTNRITCTATVRGRSQTSTIIRKSLWQPILFTVPATVDLWLSGMPDGTKYVYGGETDIAPAQTPYPVPGLLLVAGSRLKFTATGACNNTPSAPPAGQTPNGGSSTFTAALGTQNGIASLTAPTNSLVGVFLGPSKPSLTAAPTMLTFSTQTSRNYLTLSPLLKQPFFIGKGVTSNGTKQAIIVPAGATRLFLCNMDSYGWWNNYGSFNVTIQPAP